MKLLIPLLTLTCFQVSASSYAQQVTLNKKNISLEMAFADIHKQTQYQFVYPYDLLKTAKKVSIDANNAPLKKVLVTCFKDQPFTYLLADKAIIVKRKPEARRPEPDVLPLVEVTGRISDSRGNPLPGVTIKVKNGETGLVTDAQGNYSLTAPDDAVLIVSYIGFQTKEIPINGRNKIDIVLTPLVSALNQVVVIGYGSQSRKDLTGSIAQISSKDLNAAPVFNVEQALQGRAPGVVVTQNSGRPGGEISIRIRGDNSIIGDNEPLYVVDGFPIKGGIDYLSPSDIESISILKDASATAIYGARGSNGVVIITTKSGKKGTKGRIELNSYYGFQKEVKRYHLLNAKQYAIVANEYLKNDGHEPYWSQEEINALGEGTDWWSEFIKPAPIQSHTLNISGGGDKTTYSWSLNYFNQGGLLVNSKAIKGNSRLNLGYDVNDRVRLGLHLILGRSDVFIHPYENAAWHDGILDAAPTLPVYDDEGNLTRVGTAYSWTLGNIPNPGIYDKPYKNETLRNSVLANASIEVKITDELTFNSRNGIDYRYIHHEQFAPSDRLYPDLPEADNGYIGDELSYSNSFLLENTLRYLKTFNTKHRVDLVGGVTYQKQRDRSTEIEVNKLASNITKNYDIAGAGLIHTPSSGFSEWTIFSGLGRVNYAFNDKYFITGSFRADASSRFGANNKWGFFPSVAVAWNLTKEPFMSNAKFIDNLKLRASYGSSGNTALNPYQSLNRLTSSIAVLGGNSNTIGYAPSNVGNPDLKWETTKQLDIGLDLDVWDDLLYLNFDYYRKVTSDLLASVPLPASTGFNSVLKNIGKIENHGFELGVRANILRGDFKWNLFGQVSTNQNTILELANGDDIIGPTFGHPFEESLNIMREGQPIGVFYGLLEDGLNEEGYYKYKDVNNDGVVNSSDRVIIGNPNPKFTYSLNNDFSYKGFGLNIFFQGIEGRDLFWATAGVQLSSYQDGINQFAELFGNYWTSGKPDAKYQKISSASYTQISDKYVKDGSYLRLKSITLSYNIPLSKISWLKEVQIYSTGTNLLTLTNYPGLDPEVNTRGNTNFKGVDQDTYPTAKQIIIGAKVTF